MTLGRTLREAAGVAVVAALLAVYFTWPLAPRIGSVGRVDSGDGQFSIWNVAWVARALVDPQARVFDANIFHPIPGTLAYSEANLGAGVLAVPGYWMTRNAFVAHNSAVLIGLVFAVIGMYLLALRLSGSRPGALVAAVAFAFCPFVFAHTAHIQLLMIAPLPFVFLALHALVDRQSPGRAALLGLALAVQALFCAYWGVLAGLLAGFGVLFFAVTRGAWRQPRWWALGLLAAVVSIAIVLPFFLPYLDVQKEGFGRALDEARVYSSSWRDYLASSAWLHAWMLPFLSRSGGWVEVLFPGFVAIGLAGAAVATAVRAGRPEADGSPNRRETVAFYLSVACVSAWASLGPQAGLYTLLYHTVPVFSMLRAPARFGLAVILALAVLAAIGLAAILERQPSRRRIPIAAGVIALVIAELSMTMPFVTVAPWPRAYVALAGERPGPVAEFPFYYREDTFFRHSRYMLGSTVHWQPLVNGYSDHIPADFRREALLLSSFPNPEGFEILRARRARYAVFHLSSYDSANRRAVLHRIEAYGDVLKPLVKDDNVWLYEIVRWPDRHPKLAGP